MKSVDTGFLAAQKNKQRPQRLVPTDQVHRLTVAYGL